ncbi:FAD-linked oxidase C-terminal domain-containing protein [Sulfurimonas sp.]|uniref:FAD-linked oxidase C-terminal domain-containing protein n=1 Tax=Sulfurimonas sp. TaxID=2022749 RepID=UPI0025E84FBB|nr:FAD-linked oxidase C-terminal domain-containing protein [Sulfurimonas sp.]MDD5158017.1 FAD-linked oxidase C-terminal domain-containing protein [Sulfurimonas sp.]
MIEAKHLEYFTSIVGDENIYSDKAHLIAYSYDATREHFEPDAVIFPRDEDDISKILKYCNEHIIVIVPRGAGSGFTGGALPSSGGVVLAMERHMNKILEIDMKNMVAVVQPGVINMELQQAVEAVGLFYPPDPASQEYSSIGGNVSENAGGMRAAKYGITKDYVMATRAVLPNGDIIKAGKRTIKDVAGYNISGILIASEGTLAVLSEITLKLIPKPKMTKTAMGIFPTVSMAMEAVYKTMASGITPVAMEFLDNLTIRAVEQIYKKGLPVDAGALLVTDVDGNLEEDLNFQLAQIEKVFKENGCSEFKIAKNDAEAKDIWFARRNASQSLSVYGSKKLNEDVTVPRSALPELLERFYAIADKYNIKIPCFGHTGDGNVHTNVMVDGKDPEQVKIAYLAIEEVFQATIDLGGTLSGEHGIGLAKAPYMHMAFTDEEMNLFRSIKKAFDPNNILNPSKMGL